MLWSIPIGTIAGAVVRIHVTFLLWIGAAQWRVGGRAPNSAPQAARSLTDQSCVA
jgi:hypothetical protein